MEMARETERGADGDRLLLIGLLEIPSTRPTDGGGPERPPTGTEWDTSVADSGLTLMPLRFPAPLTLAAGRPAARTVPYSGVPVSSLDWPSIPAARRLLSTGCRPPPFLYAVEIIWTRKLPPSSPPDRRAIQPDHIKSRTCSALALTCELPL